MIDGELGIPTATLPKWLSSHRGKTLIVLTDVILIEWPLLETLMKGQLDILSLLMPYEIHNITHDTF